MSNKYTPCGGFIIASNGQQYPVETAHPLPLPEGIEVNGTQPNGYAFALIFARQGSELWHALRKSDSTHWLARRPLPEVPRVKTQAQLDGEAFEAFCAVAEYPATHIETWKAALAYARQCPSTPAQQQPAA